MKVSVLGRKEHFIALPSEVHNLFMAKYIFQMSNVNSKSDLATLKYWLLTSAVWAIQEKYTHFSQDFYYEWIICVDLTV